MILALLLGCGGPAVAPAAPSSAPTSTPTAEVATMTVDAWSPTPAEIGFDWQLARAGEALTITYTVQNRAAETLWLADRTVQTSQGKAALLDRPVVRRSGRAGTALVAFGLVPPDAPLFYLPPPTYRAVEPGASTQGSLSLSLPLQSWHPAAKVEALGDVSALIFALDGFLGEPSSWKELTDGQGQTYRVPAYKSRHWIWSEAKAIPPG